MSLGLSAPYRFDAVNFAGGIRRPLGVDIALSIEAGVCCRDEARCRFDAFMHRLHLKAGVPFSEIGRVWLSQVRGWPGAKTVYL